ncbi:SGNH/GDSL hydrolase family protein [Paenibacillus sp. NPDC056579]|uniref:SGNH/GDSL hydrolase family protein n=1 Tax=Paenibacillus sp. NPDC056579 TaxID=3345871 RepID=UPI0036D1518A
MNSKDYAKSTGVDFARGIDLRDMGEVTQDYGFMLPEYDNPRELHRREGLPHVLDRLEQGQDVKVGYIGGSITLQQGWRPRTTAWLKSRFPKADIVEINAAINGTGADFGAARIEQHLLAHNPDLIFVEFAVNGGSEQDIEGMVRKIWRNNPSTDICFVYTLKSDQIPSYSPQSEPSFPSSIKAFETVGEYYGIPGIFLGYVVGDLYARDKLVPKAAEWIDREGRAAFSKDGVHPVGIGDQLYAGTVARCIMKMLESKKNPAPRVLKAPLFATNWERATMKEAAEFSGSLEVLDTRADDFSAKFPYTGYNLETIKTIYPRLVKLAVPGDTITVKFKGTILGIADAGGPFSGQLRVTVDSHLPILINRFTVHSANLRHQYFYLPEMEDAEHTVTFTLMPEASDKRHMLLNKADYDQNPEAYEGNEVYLGQMLVVGEFLLLKGNKEARDK